MKNNCNVCGERLDPCFNQVRDPLTREIFRIDICARCGLGHTLPQPEDLAPYYAAGYYGGRHGFSARFRSHRRLGIVTSAVVGGKRGRILDVGCGDGSFLLAARRSGWEVMGTELNPSMARELGLDVRENLSQVGEGELFDCITMWHTLEHMRDIPFTLGRVAILLKPDGRLILAVPDWGGIQAKTFREVWLHLDVPRHLYHFNRNSLEHCLKSAGFSPERYRHMELEYDLLGWSQSALNRLTPWPNLFFDILTGKGSGICFAKRGVVFGLGALLSAAALPAVAIGSLAGSGGTLIAIAKKEND